jgi:hypothetical protein
MLGRMSAPFLARRTAAAAALLSLALLAGACTSSGKPGDGGRSHSPDGSGSGSSGGTPPPTSGSTFPLGQVQAGGDGAGCLPGDKCKAFTVTCPGIGQDAKGILDIGDPSGQPRGLLVFLSGGGGDKLWSQEAKQDLRYSGGGGGGKPIDEQAAKQGSDLLQGLRQRGFMTIQVVWKVAWLGAPKGQAVGPAKLGCRPATLLKWLHDNYFDRMGVDPAPLQCGFCVTGNSGGASQIAYSLAFYGLGDIIDAAVETGGPPHAALAKACLNQPGYEYTPGLDSVLDASYGIYRPERGPCQMHDQSWKATWTRDGADTGGSAYAYPNTRVLLILGGQDDTAVGPHQMDYLARLQRAGSPHLDQVTIPAMTHAITADLEGLNRIRDWFLASS